MAGQLQWLRRCECWTGSFTWHRQFWGISSGWPLRFNKELASLYNFSLSQVKPKCPHPLNLHTYFQKPLFLNGPSVDSWQDLELQWAGWEYKEPAQRPQLASFLSFLYFSSNKHNCCRCHPQPCLLQLCKQEHTNLCLGASSRLSKFTEREQQQLVSLAVRKWHQKDLWLLARQRRAGWVCFLLFPNLPDCKTVWLTFSPAIIGSFNIRRNRKTCFQMLLC